MEQRFIITQKALTLLTENMVKMPDETHRLLVEEINKGLTPIQPELPAEQQPEPPKNPNSDGIEE